MSYHEAVSSEQMSLVDLCFRKCYSTSMQSRDSVIESYQYTRVYAQQLRSPRLRVCLDAFLCIKTFYRRVYRP